MTNTFEQIADEMARLAAGPDFPVRSAKKTFDPKCYDLAAEFLQDEPALFTETHNVALAAAIQSVIEDYIDDAKRNYEPPDPMAHVEFPFAENH